VKGGDRWRSLSDRDGLTESEWCADRCQLASFEQVRGEAVPQRVGIHLLINTGTAGGMLASVARGLGIHGLIATVPAIAGKQPDTGLFSATVASARAVPRAGLG